MFDYEDMSLEDLYDLKRKMEDEMNRFVSDGGYRDEGTGEMIIRNFHTGDQGYQDRLGDIGEVEEEIERRESMPKNNEHKMNNLMGFDQFSLNEKKKL